MKHISPDPGRRGRQVLGSGHALHSDSVDSIQRRGYRGAYPPWPRTRTYIHTSPGLKSRNKRHADGRRERTQSQSSQSSTVPKLKAKLDLHGCWRFFFLVQQLKNSAFASPVSCWCPGHAPLLRRTTGRASSGRPTTPTYAGARPGTVRRTPARRA